MKEAFQKWCADFEEACRCLNGNNVNDGNNFKKSPENQQLVQPGLFPNSESDSGTARTRSAPEPSLFTCIRDPQVQREQEKQSDFSGVHAVPVVHGQTKQDHKNIEILKTGPNAPHMNEEGDLNLTGLDNDTVEFYL